MAKKNPNKHTNTELREKHIGEYMVSQSIGNPDLAGKWRVKVAAYVTEGVWVGFKLLRNSLKVLLSNEKDHSDFDLFDRCAQIIMDTYLFRRGKDKSVEMPKEVLTVAADGDEFELFELFEVEEVENGRSVSENEKIRWVNENMRVAGITLKDAPSTGAYGMLLHYRKNDSRREKFYDTLVPRLMTKEETEKGDKLHDTGKDTIELIDRLLSAL